MGKGIVKLGEGNWAVKDGNLLASKETNGRFKNAEFTVTRGTRATYVGRDGLIKESNLQNTNLVPSIITTENNNGGVINYISSNIYSSTSDGTSTSIIRPKFDFNTTSGKTYKLVITPTGAITGTVNFDFHDGSSYLFQDYDFTTTKEIYFTDNGNVFGSFDGQQTYSIDSFTISVQEIKTDTPRIDFTDNTDGHLLLEPQSTNYVTHSSDFSNSYFQKIRSTILSNQIISPDGTQNADKFVEDSALTTKLLWTQDLTVSVGDTITWSLFAKKGERKWIYLRDAQAGNFTNWFDLENGVVGSSSSGSLTSSIQDMGNGWYRCSITYTSTTTTARGRIYTALSDNTEAYQGDGSSGVYIWGAQLEVSPYATSYIPTNGSTVTRDADTCTGAGEAVDFNSSEGVLYIETAALANSGTFRLISISDGTLNNEVTLYYRNNDDRITARLRSGSGSQVIFESFNLTATNFSKVAFRYKGGESNVFIDGVKQKASDYATTSMPVGLNSLQLSEGQPGNLPFYGKCKAIRVYKEALSDSELVTLTS